MKFKVGDKVVVTGYIKSSLEKRDVGKVIEVIEIDYEFRLGPRIISKAFQKGTDSENDTNYVLFIECRLLTPLEELL